MILVVEVDVGVIAGGTGSSFFICARPSQLRIRPWHVYIRPSDFEFRNLILLHQLHRFKEAEALACQVVATRGSFLDYGLLGDALMEQGKLYQAELAYQKMMDLRPFYQSYARAAHVRTGCSRVAGASVDLVAEKTAQFRSPICSRLLPAGRVGRGGVVSAAFYFYRILKNSPRRRESRLVNENCP